MTTTSTISRSVFCVGFAAPMLVLATVAFGQTPDQKCNDRVPPVCAHAKYLGTDKGCSCFVCNPDDRTKRVIVCTRNEADKRALFGRVDPPPTLPPPRP